MIKMVKITSGFKFIKLGNYPVMEIEDFVEVNGGIFKIPRLPFIIRPKVKKK